MEYICGACHQTIRTHETRKNRTITCTNCGAKNTVEGANPAISTMWCGCGVIIISEGKEGWIEYPINKGKEGFIKVDVHGGKGEEVQSLQQPSGTVG
jgi:DNA-directed RNA polymerase subunit RPC12/RpoP